MQGEAAAVAAVAAGVAAAEMDGAAAAAGGEAESEPVGEDESPYDQRQDDDLFGASPLDGSETAQKRSQPDALEERGVGCEEEAAVAAGWPRCSQGCGCRISGSTAGAALCYSLTLHCSLPHCAVPGPWTCLPIIGSRATAFTGGRASPS